MKNKSKNSMQEQTGNTDIVELILDDHVALKKLIKVLKDDDADLGEKYAAFGEFAPLLTIHAKPEEQTLYVDMKEDEEQKLEGLEGDIEHALADQLVNELKMETDDDVFEAKVKVLAEMVEHHIEEEEEEMLPEYRKNTDIEKRIELGAQFLELKEQIGMEHPMFNSSVKDNQSASLH